MLTLVSLALLPVLGGGIRIILTICCIGVLRFMPGLIMGAYILSSTTVSEFIAAFHRMHIPDQITIPLSVMFRFFPTVTEEMEAINSAMKMRDIRFFSKNAGKLLEYRLIPLLVCTVNIGQELSAAALTRGLSAEKKRTNICRIGFHLQDIAAFVIALYYALLQIGITICNPPSLTAGSTMRRKALRLYALCQSYIVALAEDSISPAAVMICNSFGVTA